MNNLQTLIELDYQATTLRKKLNLDESSPIDLFAVANNIPDLTLVFYELGDNISGICYKDIGMIAINSQQSYGRCRFTLAHEFYHYFIEQREEKIICSKSLSKESSHEEKLADMFASYFLAPYKAFKDKTSGLSNETITEEQIIRLEQYFGMSREATLYRLKLEGIIDNNWDRFKNNVIYNAKILGYDDKLYKRLYYSNITFGRYLSLVKELKNQDVISRGKEIELLLTAFRGDLIEGEVKGEESRFD